MSGHFQKVMSKHGVIRDFTKAKHGRLSEVDHEPETKTDKSQVYNSTFLCFISIIHL